MEKRRRGGQGSEGKDKYYIGTGEEEGWQG
jgi:hypothetical protein